MLESAVNAFTNSGKDPSAYAMVILPVGCACASTGSASATSRTLAQGHSHIFTAILTTGASTFGWSMV